MNIVKVFNILYCSFAYLKGGGGIICAQEYDMEESDNDEVNKDEQINTNKASTTKLLRPSKIAHLPHAKEMKTLVSRNFRTVFSIVKQLIEYNNLHD